MSSLLELTNKYSIKLVYLNYWNHTSDPKKAKFQGHSSNKLDVKLSFVYYIIVL